MVQQPIPGRDRPTRNLTRGGTDGKQDQCEPLDPVEPPAEDGDEEQSSGDNLQVSQHLVGRGVDVFQSVELQIVVEDVDEGWHRERQGAAEAQCDLGPGRPAMLRPSKLRHQQTSTDCRESRFTQQST